MAETYSTSQYRLPDTGKSVQLTEVLDFITALKKILKGSDYKKVRQEAKG